jgi:integral membrane protein (TIGR01906 family)
LKNSLATSIATLLTPVVIISMALFVIARPWFITYEYSKQRLPHCSLAPAHCYDLALMGLHAVTSSDQSMVNFENATLQPESPAFNAQEVDHMKDVRALVSRVYRLSFIAMFVLILIAMISLEAFLAGLLQGAVGMLCVIGIGAIAIMGSFDRLFLWFHELFFKPDTYLFERHDLLIQIYPEPFWVDATSMFAIVTALVSSIIVMLVFGIRRGIKAQHGVPPR